MCVYICMHIHIIAPCVHRINKQVTKHIHIYIYMHVYIMYTSRPCGPEIRRAICCNHGHLDA